MIQFTIELKQCIMKRVTKDLPRKREANVLAGATNPFDDYSLENPSREPLLCWETLQGKTAREPYKGEQPPS